MRRLAFVPALLLPAVLAAEPCVLDVAPAATLLVPYVSVEMNGDQPDPSGASTILRVTNTAPEAALIQLTVWSADGVPALSLTEVLSGYDIWTVNFSDVLSGHWSRFDTSRHPAAYPNMETIFLKRTPFEWGPDGRSFNGLCVYQAPFTSPWPRGLAAPTMTSATPGEGCAMPYGDVAGLAVAATVVETLRAPLHARGHRGCGQMPVERHITDWLSTLSQSPLFFYATVDVVSSCTGTNPTDPAYLGSILADRNVLVGDVVYLGGTKGTLESTPAVHVQTGPDAEWAAKHPGPYEAMTGVEDRREPLPTAFAVRYANQTPGTARFARRSALMLWKTSMELSGTDGVTDCGGYMYYAWDEDEHVMARVLKCPVSPCGYFDIDPDLFPFRTQAVPLTAANFDLPADAGWLLLLLPPSYRGFVQDPTPGAPAQQGMQGVAAVRHEVTLPGGTGSAWSEAAVMGHAHCEPTRPITAPRRRLAGR
ncbi:MAG: hypothetical protein AB2L07_20105 [Thermoanaerobaculaceae bacterium]